jgi:uncharacterized protein (TIGR02145 family)
MKKAILLIFVCTICSFTISYSQEKLEVEGAIIIKNSEDPTPAPGTIRWTGTDFQGWNGRKWVSLTSGIAFEGEVMDIDGNIYPTIKIGSQEWMAENLRTTRYRDGTSIPNVTDDIGWSNANYGAWCLNIIDSSFEHLYGNLYNWYAVNDGRGLCPTGWHVPTDTEWTILTNFFGGLTVAGGPMKEVGTAHWNSPNTGATNASGFTGLPGGLRDFIGSFITFGNTGHWWSSTESGASGWYRVLYYNGGTVGSDNEDKRLGLSVRCLRD